MNYYTTIFFEQGMYKPDKHKLDNLRNQFNVLLDKSKIKESVAFGEILEIYSLFKSQDRIIVDKNLKNRNGATAVFSNDNESLKIIVFDSVDEDESPPVLLIYKGYEREFYKEMVKICAYIGCEIGKLVEDENGIEVIFKRKRSKEEIEEIQNIEMFKIASLNQFKVRIKELINFDYSLCGEFVKSWERCVENYGYYNIRNLTNEIESRNKDEE